MQKTRNLVGNPPSAGKVGILLITLSVICIQITLAHSSYLSVLQTLVCGLAAALLTQANWSAKGLQQFLLTGPTGLIVLFVGWAFLSFTLTMPQSGLERGIAFSELIRFVAGAILYCSIIFGCRSGAHFRGILWLLLGGGLVFAVAGILLWSPAAMNHAPMVFNNKQLLAAVLAVLLPISAVFAWRGETKRERRLGACALLLMGCALLLTGNRTSWCASLAGLLFAVLFLRKSVAPRTPDIRTRLGVSRCGAFGWLALTISVVCIFAFFGAGTAVLNRVTSVGADGTIQWRLRVWSACTEMIAQRPVIGWGIGSFAFKAGDYSPDVPSAEQVEQRGVTLSSMAHNEYLQIAVEMGLVQLLLYLAILASFFQYGMKSVRQMPDGARKWILLAALAAVAAQCVDTLGNPGWHFRDISLLLWLFLGMGVAAAQGEETVSVSQEIAAHEGQFARFGRWAVSGVAVASLLLITFAGSTRRGWAQVILGNQASAFEFLVVAQNGQHRLIEIASYASINDHGNVAFVGIIPYFDPTLGATRVRGGIFVGDGVSEFLPSVTEPFQPNVTPYDYYYGPPQINNFNWIVATQVKSPRAGRTDPLKTAFGLWFLPPSMPHFYFEYTATPPDFDKILPGVSISNSNPIRAVCGAFRDGSSHLLKVPGTVSVDHFEERIGEGESPLYPMVADNGAIVVKVGGHENGAIRLYRPTQSDPFGMVKEIASNEMGFTFLGNSPGISDNGKIVVFYGELSEEGAAEINSKQGLLARVTHGAGIFASVATNGTPECFDASQLDDEGRLIVRVAGMNGSYQLDPGETFTDLNGNGTYDGSPEFDNGPIARFDSEERIGVNNSGTVVYVGVESPSSRRCLYLSDLKLEAVPTRVSPPEPVIKQGDTLDGRLPNSFREIKLTDPINNEDELAFVVRTGGIDPVPSQTVLRVRPLLSIHEVKMSDNHTLQVIVTARFSGRFPVSRAMSVSMILNGTALNPDTSPDCHWIVPERLGREVTHAFSIDLRQARVPRFEDNQKFAVTAFMNEAGEERSRTKHDNLIPLPLVFVHGILTDLFPDYVPRELFCRLKSHYPEYTQDDGFPQLRRPYPTLVAFTYPSVQQSNAVSAAELADWITSQVIPATYADKVNIACHSMGGLVSRYAIWNYDMSQRVKTLIMIGSPTEGATLAPAALEHWGAIKSLTDYLTRFQWDWARKLNKAMDITVRELRPTYPWFRPERFAAPIVPPAHRNAFLETLNAQGLHPKVNYYAIVASRVSTPTLLYGRPDAWRRQLLPFESGSGQGDGIVPIQSQRADNLRSTNPKWARLIIFDDIGAAFHTEETEHPRTAVNVDLILWPPLIPR
jgi:O-antigen ligase/triacylglycerol esterase/lipase EstA (alpha/beta hydrolase family)